MFGLSICIIQPDIVCHCNIFKCQFLCSVFSCPDIVLSFSHVQIILYTELYVSKTDS